jgi:stage III sporulation protein AF
MLIVISPLMKLFDLEDDLEYYLGSNEQSAEALSFRKSLAYMEEKQRQAVFDDYRDKLREQVEQFLSEEELKLTEFNVSFETDSESSNFGGIISIDVKAEYINDGTDSPENKVIRIDIEKIVLGSSEREDRSLTPLEINIKNKLSDFYNIEPANINISIQGG